MTDHPTAPPRWRISSFSTNGGSCVEIAEFRISSFSTTGGSCVAVADGDDVVLIRNSNHPDAGTLTFTTSAVRAFIDDCKTGDLDHLGR